MYVGIEIKGEKKYLDGICLFFYVRKPNKKYDKC